MYLKDIVLGIDFWQTIVHDDAYGNKVPYPGAIEVITQCCRKVKAVYIISRAGEAQRLRTLNWFAESGFHEKTGLPKHHVFFCGATHQKGIISDKLGINCFIDDRPKVMAGISRNVYRILFRPRVAEVDAFNMNHLKIVGGWNEIERIIFSDSF